MSFTLDDLKQELFDKVVFVKQFYSSGLGGQGDVNGCGVYGSVTYDKDGEVKVLSWIYGASGRDDDIDVGSKKRFEGHGIGIPLLFK